MDSESELARRKQLLNERVENYQKAEESGLADNAWDSSSVSSSTLFALLLTLIGGVGYCFVLKVMSISIFGYFLFMLLAPIFAVMTVIYGGFCLIRLISYLWGGE